MKNLKNVGIVLFVYFLCFNNVFAICTTDSKVEYMDGYTDRYKNFSEKVDKRIQNIIENYSRYEWNRSDGHWVQPKVNIKACETKNCYRYKYNGEVELGTLYEDEEEIYVINDNIGNYTHSFDKEYIKSKLDGHYLLGSEDQARKFCKMQGYAEQFDFDEGHIYGDWYQNGTGRVQEETKIVSLYENGNFRLTDRTCENNNCIKNLTCIKNYNSNIEIYKNGKDYVLSNYSNIVSNISSNIDTSFKSIDKNILNYNTGDLSFDFEKVCFGLDCSEFKERKIPLNYDDYIRLFRPTDGETDSRLNVNEHKTFFDSYSVVSLDKLNFTGTINIQLPFSGCNSVKYTYEILYKDKEDPWERDYITRGTKDSFTLSNSSGKLIGEEEDILEQKQEYIKVDFNETFKKAELSILEGLYLSRAGEYNFYLQIKDSLGNEDRLKLNSIPIEVVAGPPDETKSSLEVDYEDNKNYYIDDAFNITFHLKDSMGNVVKNYEEGINVAYNRGGGIQFLHRAIKEGEVTVQEAYWQNDYINNVKTAFGSDDSDDVFTTKIRFKEIGNHPFKFEIQYPNDDGSFKKIDVGIRENGSLKEAQIQPKDNGNSDFDFETTCTSGSVILQHNCVRDDFSGCGDSDFKEFTEESNSRRKGELIIKDKAYNQKTKVYNFHSIDKTPPSISFQNFVGKTTILATSDPLKINVEDRQPEDCSSKKDIKVYVNDSLELDESIYGGATTAILQGVFEESGFYNIEVSVTDDAGNTTRETKQIRVIPNNNLKLDFEGIEEQAVTDGHEEVKLSFIVKDEFDNILSGKDLIKDVSMKSDSVLIEKLNSILTNKTQEGESLYIKNFSKTIDENGKINVVVVFYNKSISSIGLSGSLSVLKRKEKDEQPYYKKLSDSTPAKIDINLSEDKIKNIMNKVIFSGEDTITLGYDIPLYLKIPTECSNPKGIDDINIKLDLSYSDSDSGTPIDSLHLLGATGYVEMVDKLKNQGYTMGDVNCGDPIYLSFTGRFEANEGVPSPKFNVNGRIDIDYVLNGEDGKKEVLKEINIGDTLEVNYWGANVIGMFSNNSKGLYEVARKGNLSMSKGGTSVNNKYRSYNNIIKKIQSITRGHNSEQNSLNDISGIYYYKDEDVVLEGGKINSKSLIFVEGGNISIEGDIRKNGSDDVLTIVTKSDKDENGGKIWVDQDVSNIDAAIIAGKGIHSYRNFDKRVEAVKGSRNSDLRNQLVIYGFVLSKGNTIGGSIATDGSYVLPGGKEIPVNKSNYYKAGSYDLNFLRRYHYKLNFGGSPAEHPIEGNELSVGKYGTNPVVIFYDTNIKSAYGF